VPLSTVGGGFFNVNMEVAAAAKRHIEKRFGDGQVWILNPGVPEANIPNGSAPITCRCGRRSSKAGRAWERISIRLLGPQDFVRYLALDGNADMQKIEQFFDSAWNTTPISGKRSTRG
jgi:hypothetical protein